MASWTKLLVIMHDEKIVVQKRQMFNETSIIYSIYKIPWYFLFYILSALLDER